LIRNGGFETAEDWTNWIRGNTACPAAYSTAVVHSGSWSMRLGITDQDDAKTYSSVYQTVAIPDSAASAMLSFWYYPLCQDYTAEYDWQEVIIFNDAWQVMDRAMRRICSDSQAWTHHTFDLSAYKGQTIILYFNAYNDGIGNRKTAMYLDDVSVYTWCPTSTPTPTVPATATPTSTPTATPTSATPTLERRIYLPLIFKAWPPPEFRGLWVDRWSYQSPEDVEAIVQKAAQANFNAVFLQVRGKADAYYQSNYEPWAAGLTVTGTLTRTQLGQDPGWDPLQLAIDEAHARGLQLHAWVNVYPAWLGESPPPSTTPEHMYNLFNELYGDNWVQWDGQGQPMRLNKDYLWASPGHEAVSERIVHVCQDIVTNHQVDGLHLDQVRYAGPDFSHDPISEATFTQAQILDPDLTWADWQRAQVTHLVGQIYEQVVLSRPDVMLTAAVWPIYRDYWDWITNDGYDGYYQDSQGWMSEEVIDGIAPMLYADRISLAGEEPGDYALRFDTLIRDFVAADNGRFVLAGIYAGTSPSLAHYDDFSDVAQSINLARQAGATGQIIFSYRLINERDYWDDFLAGPYARPSDIPPMPWR